MMSYAEHPLLTDPVNHYKLWRYISLWKFESMLRNKALFFCRADKFIDPSEGSFPRKEAEYNKYQWRDSIDLSNYLKKLQSLTVINCWHYDETESDAMWQLYLKDNREVAIQTNFQRLKKAFKNTSEEIYIGKVRYLDYANDIFYDRNQFPHLSFNTFTPFIHKRLHFKHEQEYRALTKVESNSNFEHNWSSEENENGKFISIDIEELIEVVIVPPKADSNMINDVKEVIQTNGFKFEVSRSVIDIKPWF